MKRLLLIAALLPACGEPTTPVAERPIADAPGWVVAQKTATIKAVLWVEYDGTISLVGRYTPPDSASQEDE